MARPVKEEDGVVRVSVRHLVEFILRSGDIDLRRGGALPDPEIMQMGSRIHRKIQKSRGGDYRAEVPLFEEFETDDFIIRVEGRADGIFTGSDGVTTVDEIKGVLKNLDRLEEPVAVHLAQAKCYAAFLAREQELSCVRVQMTYCDMETEKIRTFTQDFSFDEINAWFLDLLEKYKKWAHFLHDWREIRTLSIRQTSFPYPYREGQKALAAAVYRTIERKKELFIQAPTGTGKTLATLFPAVRAVGEGEGELIFYLTARTVARTVAREGYRLLRGSGLRFKTVTLTAKEKICFQDSPECNPEKCPYAKGHYDRINEALFALITSEDDFDREKIENAAEKYQLCPFELSLDLCSFADGIIGDYNYVFHPRSRLARFFGEGEKGDYIFLIDEAHNLVDRGRDMYSAALIKEDFLKTKKLLGKGDEKLSKSLGRISRLMLAMKREAEQWKILESVDPLIMPLLNLCSLMKEWLEEPRDDQKREAVLDLYFQVSFFLDISSRLDECYEIYQAILENGDFMVKLLCVDPSVNLQECMDRGRGSVLFSATLLPGDYYKQLLCTHKDCYAVYAKSCFDSRNLRVMICEDTSSRYADRSEEMYQKIAAYLQKMVLAKRGNYMAFFPSYKMMEDVAGYFQALPCPEYALLMQTQGMNEQEREAFLARFEEKNDEGLIGFCVMGSIFGEGIDLKGSALIGAAIVGTGFPQVGLQQQILRDYCEKRWHNGFRFAYRCPGMNRVLQAAGRVIRTEEDRGVVLLMDGRFLGRESREMFPREWTDIQVTSLDGVSECLREFWESEEG